jgi:hypothetical protein
VTTPSDGSYAEAPSAPERYASSSAKQTHKTKKLMAPLQLMISFMTHLQAELASNAASNRRADG